MGPADFRPALGRLALQPGWIHAVFPNSIQGGTSRQAPGGTPRTEWSKPARRDAYGSAKTTSRSFPRGSAVAGAETLTARYCLPSFPSYVMGTASTL